MFSSFTDVYFSTSRNSLAISKRHLSTFPTGVLSRYSLVATLVRRGERVTPESYNWGRFRIAISLRDMIVYESGRLDQIVFRRNFARMHREKLSFLPGSWRFFTLGAWGRGHFISRVCFCFKISSDYNCYTVVIMSNINNHVSTVGGRIRENMKDLRSSIEQLWFRFAVYLFYNWRITR